ncbi:hypothetical protein AB0M57_00330 [Streptomyces sp. NPDC051597]|uniref:hypothetical protein n=1 Tax=Streptomyces sp. NPDC051597 TaxID=3155049 RepID=UPI00342A0F75
MGRVADLLDRSGGWYAVFRQRDPDSLAACFDGSPVPPWDVVASLLQDLVPTHGPEAVARETVRARALHTAAATAYDTRPGGREALREQLGVVLRAQAHAAERLPGAAPDESAWIQDDLARATARCAELRARIAALGPEVPRGWFGERAVARPRGGASPAAADAPHAPVAPVAPVAPRVAQVPSGPDPDVDAPPPRPATRRVSRGARFAGLETGEAGAEGGGPLLPSVAAAPTGARFGGGRQPRRQPEHARGQDEPRRERADERDRRRTVREAVVKLVRLRARGRTGEAHAVLCDAAAGPADLLPLFAGELHRAGLGADWATLLWEAASLPPDRLAAAAAALAAAGQDEDCHRLLRQGVSRPAEQLAHAVLALDDAGREREADALLDAFVRVRTPQDAAHLAAHAPARLGPRLLAAARAVSEGRRRDLVHAFRVAGMATER